MKIGVDGFRLSRQFKGNPDRHINFISELADYFPETDFLVYVTSLSREVEKSRLQSMHNVRFCLPAPSGFRGEMWRKFGITNNLGPDKVDLYHGLCGELPLNINEAGVPSVLTLSRDEDSDADRRFLKQLKHKIRGYVREKSIKKADLIIVPDEEMKSRIAENYVISPHKIKVVADCIDTASFTASLVDIYKDVMQGHH